MLSPFVRIARGALPALVRDEADLPVENPFAALAALRRWPH